MVNSEISENKAITTGVNQWSVVLGFLIFIIFVNDLMKIPIFYLFADDCRLVVSGESADILLKMWKLPCMMQLTGMRPIFFNSNNQKLTS